MNPKLKRIFILLVILCVIAAVVVGLLMAGSPTDERMRRYDAQRVNDLQMISSGVDVYWNQHQRLPASVSELQTTQNVYLQGVKDPQTQTPYDYRATDARTYDLCASFETDSAAEAAKQLEQPTYPVANNFWNHPIGLNCFHLEVHPDPTSIKPAGVAPAVIIKQ